MRLSRKNTLRAALGALAALYAGVKAPAALAVDAAWKLTDAEWRKRLSPSAFDILRKQGTEVPFSSPLDHEKRVGIYACAGCALPLYSSKTKFDSGTGWPSFYQPLTGAVDTSSDTTLMEKRTEVHCHRCAGHLGHVFDDGPKPTGLRYCMNGLALSFKPGA